MYFPTAIFLKVIILWLKMCLSKNIILFNRCNIQSNSNVVRTLHLDTDHKNLEYMFEVYNNPRTPFRKFSYYILFCCNAVLFSQSNSNDVFICTLFAVSQVSIRMLVCPKYILSVYLTVSGQPFSGGLQTIFPIDLNPSSVTKAN